MKNILFLTISSSAEPQKYNGIYGSLLYELSKSNNIYIISPIQKKDNLDEEITKKENCTHLKIKIGNITKCNKFEKGISTLLIQYNYKKAIKKYFKSIKFDLILYATPPITFCNVIKYIKKRDNAKTYLMLKDIFPQNAVDLKMFKKNSIIYKYFRRKEIELYKISDFIGCMSPKNKEYLIEHNKYLDINKIDVLPNSISPKKENIRNSKLNIKYRKKYNIPLNAKVYMYGGNLGKPQGIPFIIECLKEIAKLNDIYFVICGKGTEYEKLKDFKDNNKIDNLLLLNGLPNKEYNELLNIADVGLIFLDYNFTIPNFPSRMLSYMEKGIPILSCTDPNTDVGNIIEDNGFGWKCYSNDVNKFIKLIKKINKLTNDELMEKGNIGLEYLKNYYTCEKSYDVIIKKQNKIR